MHVFMGPGPAAPRHRGRQSGSRAASRSPGANLLVGDHLVVYLATWQEVSLPEVRDDFPERLHVSLVVLLACKWRVLLEAIGPLLDPAGGNELIAEGVAVLLEHAPRGALESAQPLDVEVEQVFVRQRHSRNILRLAREGTCQPQRRRRRSRVSVGSAPPISAQSNRGGSRGRRHLFQR